MKTSMSPEPYFIGIEGGGTKYRIMVANHARKIIAEETIPTTTPIATLNKCMDFIHTQVQNTAIAIRAIGIGQFGPVQVDVNAPDYGVILNTPKSGWQGTNVLSEFRKFTDLPITLDTDVNAAALAEITFGAAQGLTDFVYLTIGTGIGGGAVVNKKIIHGLLHPEIGHMLIPHDRDADPFEGCCPYHEDCFEGLASGPAIQNRLSAAAESLSPNHPFWNMEATYIARALVNLFFTLNSQRFILGGGVMQQGHLFPRIRSEFIKIINNYYDISKLISSLDSFIQPPFLGPDAGAFGSILLAEQCLSESN